MQLIYKGKTNKSLLKVIFLEEFLLSANEKNYSNEKKSLKFLGEFLLSYIQQERKNLGPENQKALIISFMTYFVSKLLTKSLNFWTTNNILVIKLGWLAHLISRFACNTRLIVDASSSPPVSHVI